MVAHALQEQVIEGRRSLVVASQSALPKSLATLLTEMAPFGFTLRSDFTLAGARTACEVLRVHRWTDFRIGHWSNPREFSVVIGKDQAASVPKGVRNLHLQMCADCGAVCVRDISTHAWAGAMPTRLVNTQTGQERVAPTVGRRDLVIGWYSGKRRAGREYR